MLNLSIDELNFSLFLYFEKSKIEIEIERRKIINTINKDVGIILSVNV